MIDKTFLLSQANSTGFRPEILEKVYLLLTLLNHFSQHPFLKNRFALKGGTALNLFLFSLPRLSVDIDLNYIGTISRDEMLKERPQVEAAIEAVCQQNNFQIRRVPSEHAGGKWLLRYHSSLGQMGNLHVDINFLLRLPLWPIIYLDSHLLGNYQAKQIPVLDPHELIAGKLAALFSRNATRDLFDAYQLISYQPLDREKLRLAFIVYGAINRKDWRSVSINDLSFSQSDLQTQLLPLLSNSFRSTFSKTNDWASNILQACQQHFNFWPLTTPEQQFLDLILEQGQILPNLITQDPHLINLLPNHPGLLWKALNVKKLHGIS